MFNAKIADHVIAIDNRYDYIKQLYRDYISDEEPYAFVSVNDDEIAAENFDGGNWSPAYLETLAVYRKICEQLINDDIILFHCSCLEMDGKAILFTAPSGTGKSTHSRLWRERFGSRVVMVNDDKPLIKISDRIVAYGTPYGGKDALQTNTSALVSAIVILHQAKENLIRRLEPNEAFPQLFAQTYRCSSVEAMTKTLPLVGKLSHLPVYSLGCTISQEAVELVYNEIFTQ